jgi:hypothetical protein
MAADDSALCEIAGVHRPQLELFIPEKIVIENEHCSVS